MSHNSNKSNITIEPSVPFDTTETLWNDSGVLKWDSLPVGAAGGIGPGTTVGAVAYWDGADWVETLTANESLNFDTTAHSFGGTLTDGLEETGFGFRGDTGFSNFSFSVYDSVNNINASLLTQVGDLELNVNDSTDTTIVELFTDSAILSSTNAGGSATVAIGCNSPTVTVTVGNATDYTQERLIPTEFYALTTVASSTATTLRLTTSYTERNSGVKDKVTVPGAYPYTVLATDYIVLVNASSARTINLFNLTAGDSGRTVIVKKVPGTSALVTINAFAGDTVEGAASYSLTGSSTSVTLVSDATQGWFII